MKLNITVLTILLCCIIRTQAQKKSIPCPVSPEKLTEKSFSTYFDTDLIETEQFSIADANSNGIKEVWIRYRKRAQPAAAGAAQDSDIIGLAAYVYVNNTYRLIFANDNAFFCSDCNNAGSQSFAIDHDRINISISWGPSIGTVQTNFSFSYKKSIKNWVLSSFFESGGESGNMDSNRDRPHITTRNTYMNKFKRDVLISNYEAETVPYDTTNILRSIAYYYDNAEPLSAAVSELKKAATKPAIGDFEKVFGKDDVQQLLDDYPLSVKTLGSLNDIGYYLEQMNVLDAAEVMLKAILKTYPDRMVAYLNLGDVYRKLNQKDKAKEMYRVYSRKMGDKKLERQIPAYVTTYLNQ